MQKERSRMSRTRKTLVIITGTILLLIVLFFIVLATLTGTG